jgi:DNA-binding beta-propeller fold protein YncE
MKMKSYLLLAAGIATIVGAISAARLVGLGTLPAQTPAVSATLPEYKVDPYWPKALPENWVFSSVGGVAVGPDDHIWVVHRPGELSRIDGAPPISVCCVAAPPILEFDQAGNFVSSIGPGGDYNLERPHGISVDPQGNVWVTGSNHVVQKFSRAGKLLLTLGQHGITRGVSDTATLAGPAQTRVDPETNEVYVADGEGGNRRIIVFDATTGAYKRQWGGYGAAPVAGRGADYDPKAPLSREFGSGVHCVRIARDGLVYVCDRANNRIQVFKKDGTYVDELQIAKETVHIGSIWDVVFTLDQKHLLVGDGTNQKIWIVQRQPLKLMGSFSRAGRMAGELLWVNALATDSKGNLYTAESSGGRRVQRFVPVKR